MISIEKMELINLEYDTWYKMINRAERDLIKRVNFDQYMEIMSFTINRIDQELKSELN